MIADTSNAGSPSPAPGRRLRVLHVIGGLGPGGAETMLYRLVTHPSDVQHEVICLAPRDWYSDELDKAGIKVTHLGVRSLASGIAAVARLPGLVRRSGADVVQGWMYRSNLLAGLFSKLAGIPSVWGIHCSTLDVLGPSGRLWARASGWTARWLPSFIINCSNRSAEIHAPLGFADAPGKVIHNGYQGRTFFPDPAAGVALRERLGIAPETFLIGSVARWHPQKDIPNLLRATRIAADRGTPVRCLLVGHELGEDNQALRREIVEQGCDALAGALGRRRDIVDVMRALDLHVLASSGGEAFPNVVAEAMLSGTPCVVTDVGDAGYMVGATGWVVPPRSPEALADRIVEACRERSEMPDTWSARGPAARARIMENFTIDQMAQEYEAVWRAAADDGGPPPDRHGVA